MWGKKNKSVVSNFFSGISINNFVIDSLYGKFMQAIEQLFKPNEIVGFIDKSSDSETKLLEIPSVIVIGAESSGKSSLLEHIIKTPIFPRNSSICTKQPIKLILKKANGINDVSYQIKFKNAIFHINKYDIIKKINDIMNELEPEEISMDVIEVTISEINLPNFEFIDLPGIRVYPESLAKKTLELAEKYIQNPNTIILCVVPAQTPRMTSYNPIALVKKYKMESKTILALTMCDRVQSVNIYDLIVKRIIMETDEIEKNTFAGCIGIINRTHDDSETLSDSDDKELKWFQENIINEIPDDFEEQKKNLLLANISAINLIKNLDVLYSDFIKKKWIPNTLENLNSKKLQAKINLNNLGVSVENLEHLQLNQYYTDIIYLFHSKIDWNLDFLNELDYFSFEFINHCTLEETASNVKYVFFNLYLKHFLNYNHFVNSIEQVTPSFNKNIKSYFNIFTNAQENIQKTLQENIINFDDNHYINYHKKITSDINYEIEPNIIEYEFELTNNNYQLNRFDNFNKTIFNAITIRFKEYLEKDFDFIFNSGIYEFLKLVDLTNLILNPEQTQKYNFIQCFEPLLNLIRLAFYKACKITLDGIKTLNKLEIINLEENSIILEQRNLFKSEISTCIMTIDKIKLLSKNF